LSKRSNKKSSEEDFPKLPFPKGVKPFIPRKASALDKIRSHYLEQRKLSPKLEELKQLYEYTNSLLRSGYSKQQTVNFLASDPNIGISYNHAYTIVTKTMDLFGDIHKSNKEGLRQIVIDNLWNVYRRSVESKDLREQNIALKNIASIGGLYSGQEIDWSKIVLPVPVFSTDHNVLKEQQTIDITGEDAEEDIS
jgi:hypothetical protein